MNIKELRDKLDDILNVVDHYPGKAKVLVHIGGGERCEIQSINLALKTPADEEHDEDEEYWNFEDGSPVLGVHFTGIEDLLVVIDAEE